MLTVAALSEGQNLDNNTVELLAKFVKEEQDIVPDQNSTLSINNFDNSELKANINPLSRIYSLNNTVYYKEIFKISKTTQEEVATDL